MLVLKVAGVMKRCATACGVVAAHNVKWCGERPRRVERQVAQRLLPPRPSPRVPEMPAGYKIICPKHATLRQW